MKEVLEETSNILGIDFGTTNSKMAYMIMDEPTVIRNSEGKIITPSVVYFDRNEKAIVGEQAKQHIILHPNRTVYSIKRHMGTEYRKRIGKASYPPEYIGAHILRKLAKDAESETSRKFKNIVVSVPANYSDGQRQAIKDASEIAGLKVLRMINEPTAAALAYGYKEDEDRKILIYDFGGGTFDVSILTVGKGFFDVDATSGEHRLGGDDIDKRIIDFVCKKIKKERKIDVKKDLALYQGLKEMAEEAKIKLSTTEKTTVNLPFIGKDTKHPPFEMEITRKKFEELIVDLIENTAQPITQALDDAGLDKSEVDDVILVGGTTKIPLVKDFVKKFFDKEPSSGIDPYEAVALGTAIASTRESKEKSKIDVSDVVSMSLGVLTSDGTISKILNRNTKVPITRKKPYTNPESFMSEVMVGVYQGEGLYPWECEHLGEFWVSVEPKPIFANNIDIGFDIGEDFGILNVTAMDRDSGSKRSVKLKASGRLSKREKNRWMKKMLSFEGVELHILNKLTRDRVSLNVNPDTRISDLRSELKELGVLCEEEGTSLFLKNKELGEKLLVADINYDVNDAIEIDKKEKVEKQTIVSSGDKDSKRNGRK